MDLCDGKHNVETNDVVNDPIERSQPESLADVSFGSHLEYPDGSIPTVTKANSGRMSPVRARTMKEYDQGLAELKKENFSLKLRIYFLEEKVQNRYTGDEELFKTNINLKVDCESLKKEVQEKQELLKKASAALESINVQQQADLAETRRKLQDEFRVKEENYNAKIANIEKDCEGLRLALEEASERIISGKHGDGEGSGESQGNELEAEKAELIISAQEKERIITELQEQLLRKDERIKQLETDNATSIQELRLRIANLQQQMIKTDAECQTSSNELEPIHEQDAEEHHRRIEELEIVLDQLTNEMKDKDELVGELREQLHDITVVKEDSAKQNKTEYDKLAKLNKDNVKKRDRAIQGLTQALHDKGKEVQELCEKLEQMETALNEAQTNLHSFQMSKYKHKENVDAKLMNKDTELADLEDQVHQKNLENQHLARLNEKKDGELEELRKQTGQLKDALQQQTDDAHLLDDKLDDEKRKARSKADELEHQYRMLLDESNRQLEGKDKLVQQLTKRLQDKDNQLQQYIEMMRDVAKPNDQNKDVIIANLGERVKEREKALEEAANCHFKSLEERDNEIRLLKSALREKDRDIERANEALLNAEETIDMLEREAKEKEQNIRQLGNALRSQQRAYEELQDNHVHCIEEKDAIIKKLQKSIANKEKYLEEMLNNSTDGNNGLVEQLRQQIKDRDRMLEEMVKEQNKTAVDHEKATNDFLRKLQEKDKDNQELGVAHDEELTKLNKSLQQQQTDMNKREYEYQCLESRCNWMEEQHQIMMDKMRSALKEKDKTIEALVESSKDKDRMFYQLQESMRHHGGPSSSRGAELQNLRDEVDRLNNDLLTKEGLITRLKSNLERLSKNHPDDLLDLSEELNKKNQLLTEALRSDRKAREELAKLKEQLNLPQKESAAEKITTNGGDTHIHIHQLLQDQLAEAGRLKETLIKEKEVYTNMNQPEFNSQNQHLFDEQLSKLNDLRVRYEEGLRNNEKLRIKLEEKLDETKGENEKLEREFTRSGASSRSSGATNTEYPLLGLSNFTTYASIHLTPEKYADPQLEKTIGKSLTGLSPAELRRELAHAKVVMKKLEEENLALRERLDAAFTQFGRDVIPGENCLDADNGFGASSSSIHADSLRRDLQDSRRLNDELQQELEAALFAIDQDASAQKEISSLNSRVQSLQHEIMKMSDENNRLQHRLQQQPEGGSSGSSSTTAMCNMCSGQADDLLSTLHGQYEQCQRNLERTSAENELLRAKLGVDSNADARDAPSLKDLQNELIQLQSRIKELESCETTGKPPIPGAGYRSFIPVLRKGVDKVIDNSDVETASKAAASKRTNTTSKMSHPRAASQEDESAPGETRGMRGEIEALKSQREQLERQLRSTESTVHLQGQKIKHYRSVLTKHGILTSKLPIRSMSETNLLPSAPETTKTMEKFSCDDENCANDVFTDYRTSGRPPPPRSAELKASTRVHELEAEVQRLNALLKSLRGQSEKIPSSGNVPCTPPGTRDNAIDEPKTPGIDRFTASNREAFSRLRNQVDCLKDQLHEETQSIAAENTTFVQQRDRSSSISDRLAEENALLKSRIAAGGDACVHVCRLLESLRAYIDTAPRRNEPDELDMSEIKSKLQEANKSASILSELFKDSSCDTENIEEFTDDWREQCHKLETDIKNLKEQMKTTESALKGSITEKEDKLQSLTEENVRLDEAINRFHVELNRRIDQTKTLKALLQQNQNDADRTRDELSRLCKKVDVKNKLIDKLKRRVKMLNPSERLPVDESEEDDGGATYLSNPRNQQHHPERSRSLPRTAYTNHNDVASCQELADTNPNSSRSSSVVAEKLTKENRRHKGESSSYHYSYHSVDSDDFDPATLELQNDSREQLRHKTTRSSHDDSNGFSPMRNRSVVDYLSEDSESTLSSSVPTKLDVDHGGISSRYPDDYSFGYIAPDLQQRRTLTDVSGGDLYENGEFDSYSNRRPFSNTERNEKYISEKKPNGYSADVRTGISTEVYSHDHRGTDRFKLSAQDNASQSADGSSYAADGRKEIPTTPVYSHRDQRGIVKSSGQDRNAKYSGGSSKSVHSSPNDEFEFQRREIGLLRSRLHAAEDLNNTLRDEVALYESFKVTNVGYSSSSTHHEATHVDTLQEHLNGIRSLRLRLEETINTNEHLKKQLEDQLASTRQRDADINKIHELERDTRDLVEQLDEQNRKLSDEKRSNEKLIAEVSGLKSEIAQKSQLLCGYDTLRAEAADRRELAGEVNILRGQLLQKDGLENEIERLKKQLKCCDEEKADVADKMRSDLERKEMLLTECNELVGQQDEMIKAKNEDNKELMDRLADVEEKHRLNFNKIRMLKEELHLVQEQLESCQGCNQALKQELLVYEAMKKEPKDMPGMADLLNEIGNLRVQLERSIQNNLALRQKLEKAAEEGATGSLRLSQDVLDRGNIEKQENEQDFLHHRSTRHNPVANGGLFNSAHAVTCRSCESSAAKTRSPPCTHRIGRIGVKKNFQRYSSLVETLILNVQDTIKREKAKLIEYSDSDSCQSSIIDGNGRGNREGNESNENTRNSAQSCGITDEVIKYQSNGSVNNVIKVRPGIVSGVENIIRQKENRSRGLLEGDYFGDQQIKIIDEHLDRIESISHSGSVLLDRGAVLVAPGSRSRDEIHRADDNEEDIRGRRNNDSQERSSSVASIEHRCVTGSSLPASSSSQDASECRTSESESATHESESIGRIRGLETEDADKTKSTKHSVSGNKSLFAELSECITSQRRERGDGLNYDSDSSTTCDQRSLPDSDETRRRSQRLVSPFCGIVDNFYQSSAHESCADSQISNRSDDGISTISCRSREQTPIPDIIINSASSESSTVKEEGEIERFFGRPSDLDDKTTNGLDSSNHDNKTADGADSSDLDNDLDNKTAARIDLDNDLVHEIGDGGAEISGKMSNDLVEQVSDEFVVLAMNFGSTDACDDDLDVDESSGSPSERRTLPVDSITSKDSLQRQMAKNRDTKDIVLQQQIHYYSSSSYEPMVGDEADVDTDGASVRSSETTDTQTLINTVICTANGFDSDHRQSERSLNDRGDHRQSERSLNDRGDHCQSERSLNDRGDHRQSERSLNDRGDHRQSERSLNDRGDHRQSERSLNDCGDHRQSEGSANDRGEFAAENRVKTLPSFDRDLRKCGSCIRRFDEQRDRKDIHQITQRSYTQTQQSTDRCLACRTSLMATTRSILNAWPYYVDVPRELSVRIPRQQQQRYFADGNGEDALTIDQLNKENYHPNHPARSLHLDDLTIPSPDPDVVGAMTKCRVSADLRYLYAIGKLDDYELLKKQVGELCVILKGTEARIIERLRAYRNSTQIQSIEYSNLKELSSSLEHANICAGQSSKLIQLFWTSTLPRKNERGEFVDVELTEENRVLRERLQYVTGKYSALLKVTKGAHKRLLLTNKKKEDMEEAIVQRLLKTEIVLKKARENLEKCQDEKENMPTTGAY
ncbi:uncharacterized protein LOC141909113 isoform X2 [Tubulanus polymorphus]|uniref:uncharacterized protein LOC141909113 isoform X2 n=1 Tax=Tubulanus polymorphus TaxID=672921 RepID=UPI003DA5A9B7